MDKNKLIQKYNMLLKQYAETDLQIKERERQKERLIKEIEQVVSMLTATMKEEDEERKKKQEANKKVPEKIDKKKEKNVVKLKEKKTKDEKPVA